MEKIYIVKVFNDGTDADEINFIYPAFGIDTAKHIMEWLYKMYPDASFQIDLYMVNSLSSDNFQTVVPKHSIKPYVTENLRSMLTK